MIPYIGDFAEDATIYHYFNTFDSNDPSASVTVTTLIASDLYVYKNGSVTDLVTDGASVTIDFDSRTGIHLLTIDTSVSADYSIGADYMVMIEGATVDAGNITAAIFTFSIENRYNDVNVVTVSGTTQTANDNGADINAILVDTGTDIPALIATVDANVDAILVDTATTLQGELDGIQADTEDLQTQIGAAGAGLTAVPWNAAWDVEVQSEVNDALVALGLDHLVGAAVTGTDVVDDSIIAKLVSSSATADWDTYVNTTEALQALRDRGDAAWTTGAGGNPPQLLQETTIATLASQTSFTLTAGSADNDAYNNAIIVIEDQSTAVQKAVGTISDYVGSTKTVTLSADPAIFTMAVGDTVKIIAALGAAGSAPTAAAIADAVWDEAQADHVAAGSMGIIASEIASILVDTGTTIDGLITTVDTVVDGIQTDLSNATDGLGAIKTAVDAIPTSNPTAAAIADAVWDETQIGHTTVGTFGEIATEIASILADTNELQTDNIPGTLTTIEGKIDTVDTVVDAILVDTGTTIPGTIATVDTNVDAILVDTGTTLPAQIVSEIDAVQADIGALNNLSAAQVNAEVVDVIRTDTLAELGAVPAATSTLADKINWLFMQARNTITQTATTQLVKADDTTTTVATSTISDDGTTATRGEFV